MSGNDHGERDNDHTPRDATSVRALGIAALLTGGFVPVEVAGGIVAGSLALIANAGHMLTDFATLSLAWLAFRVARRPADRRGRALDHVTVETSCTPDRLPDHELRPM